MTGRTGYTVRATSALVLCVVMIVGSLLLAAPGARAQFDDAVFNGTVTLASVPAPYTLVMYSIGDGPPEGNWTMTDSSGDYEIWVEGGETYTLYFVNGDSMFDNVARVEQYIGSNESLTVDVDLTPAPPTTVTLKGFAVNESDPMDPVVDCTILGMQMAMDSEMPDYINWTVTDSTGYYEMELLPGMLVAAAMGTPEFYPEMPGSGSTFVFLEDGESGWCNLSLSPYGSETVHVSGTVTLFEETDPIVGARVLADLEDGLSFSAATDDTGGYVVDMFEGSGEMMVSADGYVSQRQTEMYFAGDMTVDWGLIPVDAAFVGHVYDAVTHEVIEDARVYASSWLGWADPEWADREMFAESDSDADGYYHLDVGWGGNWVVSAEAEGYVGSHVGGLVLFPDETFEIDLYLEPKSSVFKGFITDESDDEPIAGVIVRIENDDTEEMAFTDSSGYYEILCAPGEYRFMALPTGYMMEMLMDDMISIGHDETIWVNMSLKATTTHVSGTVTDAVSGDSLDGAAIQFMSYSSNPGFVRVAMTYSESGSYSVFVAPDPETIVYAMMPDYRDFMTMVDVPDVDDFTYDIRLVPQHIAAYYTLKGYVNSSTTDAPIPYVDVTASHGFETLNYTQTNLTGYYSFDVPCMDLTIKASPTWSSQGYMPADAFVLAQPPATTYWLNFTMDPDSVPPVIDGHVSPVEYISINNPASINATVVEDNLGYIGIDLRAVVDSDEFTDYTASASSFAFRPDMPLWSNMDATEVGPGVWATEMIVWDTLIDEVAVLRDADGQVLYLYGEYSDELMGYYRVEGSYYNDSLGSYVPCTAWFLEEYGNLTGLDIGDGIESGLMNDSTALFTKYMDVQKVNKSTGAPEGNEAREYVELSVAGLMFEWLGVAESGSYYAFFQSMDVAFNWAIELVPFMVDSTPPTAVAMDDLAEVVNVTVTLNATASYDNIVDGIVNYTWVFDDGPDTFVLYGVIASHAFEYLGDHEATLTVRDHAGLESSDTVVVTVLPDTPPVAYAGPDQEVDEDTVVHFDGTGSIDDLEVIVNYSWIILELAEPMYGPTPSYTFSEPGAYSVEMVVRDSIGQESEPDQMTVTVIDVTAPVAHAGDDQPDVPYGVEVTLNGSGSSDNVDVVSWVWTFDDDGAVELEGMVATHTFSAPGEYNITLTVADAAGNEASDWVIVTVVDDELPVADAGDDPEGVTAGQSVTLDGSDSTDNHLIVDYVWTFDDSGDVTLEGDVVQYVFLTEGEYTVTLTVVDASGNSDTDTVVVRVAAMNEGPVADAGDDKTDVEEGDTVTFDGSGSTDDVAVVSYTWTFEYDDELQTLTGEVATFEFEIPGTYIVTLNVTDAEGEYDTDTMVVVVNEKTSVLITDYWWLLAVVAAVAVIGALVLLMKRGTGGSGAGGKEAEEGEEFEDELPPPDDEDA